RISDGTRSSAITAHAPAFSAILACSALVTSMITPPLSISARPTFTRHSLDLELPCPLPTLAELPLPLPCALPFDFLPLLLFFASISILLFSKTVRYCSIQFRCTLNRQTLLRLSATVRRPHDNKPRLPSRQYLPGRVPNLAHLEQIPSALLLFERLDHN